MVGIFPCLLQKTSLAIWYSRKLSLTLSWKSSSKRSTCKHISQLMRQKESLSTAWKKTHTHTYHTSTENASQEDAQCTKNKASWFYRLIYQNLHLLHMTKVAISRPRSTADIKWSFFIFICTSMYFLMHIHIRAQMHAHQESSSVERIQELTFTPHRQNLHMGYFEKTCQDSWFYKTLSLVNYANTTILTTCNPPRLAGNMYKR